MGFFGFIAVICIVCYVEYVAHRKINNLDRKIERHIKENEERIKLIESLIEDNISSNADIAYKIEKITERYDKHLQTHYGEQRQLQKIERKLGLEE